MTNKNLKKIVKNPKKLTKKNTKKLTRKNLKHKRNKTLKMKGGTLNWCNVFLIGSILKILGYCESDVQKKKRIAKELLNGFNNTTGNNFNE